MTDKVLKWYLNAISCLIILPPIKSVIIVPSERNLKIQNYERIEGLIKSWAPIIWLAPDEKYHPSSVEEFLENVYPGKSNGEFVQELPQGRESENVYLHTKIKLEKLKMLNNTFLHGKDPERYSIPVYATFRICDKSSSNNEIFSDENVNFQVTYWIFFPYNQGKEICLLGNIPTLQIFNTCLGKRKTFGNHVGDFEHLSMSFKNNHHPEKIYLSAHDTGVYYKYDSKNLIFTYDNQITYTGFPQRPKFPKFLYLRGGRPVLFSAHGSHGLWSAPGKHYYVRVPRLYDTNGFGKIWKTWKSLQIFRGYDDLPGWMKYRGRWGNPKSKCLLFEKLGICEISDGPVGLIQRQLDFQCDK